MRVRYNNIECRQYKSTKIPEVMFEFIKWTDNPYFEKEQEYRDNGYVDSFGGEFLQNSNKGHSIDKTFFKNRETCFVFAFLKLNLREPCTYLETVGTRLIELDEAERRDFFDVYALIEPKIDSKYLQKIFDNLK